MLKFSGKLFHIIFWLRISGLYNRNEIDFTNKIPTEKKDRYRLCAKMLIFYVKTSHCFRESLATAGVPLQYVSGVRNRNFTGNSSKMYQKSAVKKYRGIFNPLLAKLGPYNPELDWY